MRWKWNIGLVLVVVALGAATSPAHAAGSSFAASTDPSQAGTPQAPAALDVKTTVSIKTDATGNPPVGVTKLVEALPAELASQLPKFATCPRDTVTKTGPDACPRKSILGHGQVSVFVPAVQLTATSDRADLVNLGDNKIMIWFKVTKPGEYIGWFDAVVGTDASPFGPSITWDFGPAANPPPGAAEAKLKLFTTNFLRQAAESPASQRSAPRKRRPSCRSKAKRIKNRQRRKRAMKRCSRIEKKRRAARRSTIRARESADTQISPFGATGCASGSWAFQARIDYKDGSNEQLDASAPCGASSTPPPTEPPGGGLPCVPPLPCPSPAGIGRRGYGWAPPAE
jgi:hypothetical protein